MTVLWEMGGGPEQVLEPPDFEDEDEGESESPC